MTSEDNFKDLKKDFKDNQQIVLFVGAGINFTCNIKGEKVDLSWDALVKELLKNTLPKLPVNNEKKKILETAFEIYNDDSKVGKKDLVNKANELFSAEEKASLIKHFLGDSYIPMIQSFLYKNCNRKVLEEYCKNYVDENNNTKDIPFYSLFFVADMILKNKNIKAVVTYNFDNFLTEAIEILKKYYGKGVMRNINPLDVYSGWKGKKHDNNRFLIYHVHGYIQPPYEIKPTEHNTIVLSLEEEYATARDAYTWQTTTQIHFLTHYTCVYLGISLNDMNMQRMIQYADLQHSSENVYYLTAQNYEEIDGVLYKMKHIFFEYNNIKVINCESYDKLYDELKKIVKPQNKQ